MNNKYKPKTGRNAGKANREKIRELLKNNKDITGVEIQSHIPISLNSIYAHLNAINKEK